MSFRFFILAVFTSLLTTTFSQAGGQTSYDFLNLTEVARFSSLGGQNVSLNDSIEPNTFLFNPALLHDSSSHQLSFSNLPFYADIKKIGFTYVWNHTKTGTIGINFQSLNYGTITERTIDGTEIGTFSPNEYAITISKAHTIEPFSLGANLKFVGSNFGSYSSSAVMMDIGGAFIHPKRDFVIGLVFKNFGFPLKSFSNERTRLPIDIQLGISYKLEHLPLKLSITGHNLIRPDIQYINPEFHNSYNSDGELESDEKNLAAQIFRHMTFAGEFLFSKNFHVRIGYNHQRRAELSLANTRSGAGFSFGGMIRLKAFEVNYSRTIYHISGGVNVLTINMDIERIVNNRKDKKQNKQVANQQI